jgi:predicted PurR-regulated permease PerM
MTQDRQIDPDNETNLPSGGGGLAGTTDSTLPTPSADEEGSAGILGRHADVRHVSLVILTLLAVLYTLHLAAAFFLPIVLAILLNLLLSPAVRLLCNHVRMPEPLGAGIVIVVLLGVVGFGAYRLAPAASAWLARAPESLATLQRRIQPLRRSMERANQAAEQVEQATDMDKQTQEVQIKGPSLTQQVFGGTTALLSSGMVVIYLT